MRRLLAVTGTLALGAAGLLGAGSAAATVSAPPTPTFGTPVVVDHFRPGFEPDVAIDRSPKTRGRGYVTWPNGFSTTESFFLRSEDDLHSFHLTEANVGGKTATCAGGGDSEIQVNPVDGQLFFADLQGLTNFSNSTSTDGGRTYTTTCTAVPGAGVDRQWLAIDTNGGTSSVGPGAGDGRVYFEYDNVGQNTDTRDSAARTTGNQLVLNQSMDGVNYGGGPGCQTAGVTCVLPPAVISPDEGLPGNTLVDNTAGGPYQHSIYVLHNNTSETGVLLSYCRGPASGPRTAATVADACTDPTDVDPADTAHVNRQWHDVVVRKPDPKIIVEAFTVLAMDTRGGLYAAWTEYPYDHSNDVFTGTGRTMLASSSDGGQHWSTPVRVNPPTLPTPVQPWITAGDPGRVDIAYYAATEPSDKGAYGPDSLGDNGTWNVYLDQSLNALSAHPTFAHTTVSDHQVKFGNVSTQGLGGSDDRSLGDYLQVQTGLHGEAVLSYVDDTSDNRNADFTAGSGQSPPEAAGPTMVAVQTGGASLFSAVGALHGDSRRPVGSVTDPVGKGYPDAFFSGAGQDVAASSNLDVAGVSISRPDATHLQIRMDTADPALAEGLGFSPTLGGSTGEWIVRWAAPSYHKSNGHGGFTGDGNIFYVGMESVSGGAPTFYAGSTDSLDTTHAKYFVYSPKLTVPGRISGRSIVWTVPLSAVGAPAKGQSLFSVTGFTATQAGPSSPSLSTPEGGELSAYTPPNLIDAAPPFSYRLGAQAAGTAPGGSVGSTGGAGGAGGTGGTLATTGLPVALPIAALGLLALAAGLRRQRARSGDGSQLATR